MVVLKNNISKNYLPQAHHRFLFLFIAVLASWMFGSIMTATIYTLTSVDTATYVTVSNAVPAFTAGPAENSASTGANPTNVGSNVTFTATGTDPNSDDYFFAVCKTNSITPNNNAAPSCALDQTLCVTGATTSGTQASCNYLAQSGDPETTAWYAFVCDDSSGSLCSASSQGTGDSGSPFHTNHTPLFTSLTPGSAVNPGQNMVFDAVAQDNDVDIVQDTVHLIVCSVAGATSSGCTNPANQLCASGNETSDPSCTYTTPNPFAAGNHNYYAYIFDQHGLGYVSNPRTGTYTINNISPVLSNLNLNGGSNINLTVSTTTQVHLTYTISDANGYGDVVNASNKLYRTAVGAGAGDNANNHYTVTSCSISNQSGASADYDCTFNVQFHADPTDVANTQYFTDTWTGTSTITDAGSLQATDSATPVELNSLLGVSIDSNIDYGSLSQGQNSGATNQIVEVSSQGNTGLDTLLQGTDMSDGDGHVIPVENQKYSASTFTYTLGGTALGHTDVLLGLHVTKTTVTASPSTKNTYWGILIPLAIPSVNYTGTNTITAQVSDQANW